jgi:hypothetical protein
MSNHHNNNNQNNNNNKNLLEKVSRFDKKNIKMYASLALYALLGLALGFAIAKGGMYLFNKSKTMKSDMKEMSSEMKTETVKYTGSVSHNFEGENKTEVSFDHDKSLSVTQGEGNKSKYFYVNNASGTKVATVYMSYEGGRGYTADDYVKEVLLKAVPSAKMEDSMTHGSSTWLKVSSTNSVWHVKSSEDKQWVTLVENTKANSDLVKSVLDTFTVK